MVSKDLKDILERIETWPESRQDDAARVHLDLEARDATGYRLIDAQVEEVRRRRADPHRTVLILDELRERFQRRHS